MLIFRIVLYYGVARACTLIHTVVHLCARVSKFFAFGIASLIQVDYMHIAHISKFNPNFCVPVFFLPFKNFPYIISEPVVFQHIAYVLAAASRLSNVILFFQVDLCYSFKINNQ